MNDAKPNPVLRVQTYNPFLNQQQKKLCFFEKKIEISDFKKDRKLN